MDITVDPKGSVSFAGCHVRCALGRGGVRADKREGDGATPVGRFRLLRVYVRSDRVAPPATALEAVPITADMGWCDDPTHADYNALVRLPHPAHHEVMWRGDGLYDVVIEIDHNHNPIVAGAGSAVFLHVAKPDYAATEGCVALALVDLLDVLAACEGGDTLIIPDPEMA